MPAGGAVVFAPATSVASEGAAATVATVQTDPPASVTVLAVVEGSDPAVAAAVVLPHPLPASGTPLEAGLNELIWTGPHSYISAVVAPIARLVVGAWRFDRGAGWQGYLPAAGRGEDYLIAHGDRVWVRVTRDVLLPDVELAWRPPGVVAVELERVIDGDTIVVRLGSASEWVRLIGIDTPERGEPWAGEATEHTAVLLSGGAVYVEADTRERDRFGSVLRYVWVRDDVGRWTMVNLALVEEGLAEATPFPPDVKHAERLQAAEDAARAAGRGIWSGE